MGRPLPGKWCLSALGVGRVKKLRSVKDGLAAALEG